MVTLSQLEWYFDTGVWPSGVSTPWIILHVTAHCGGAVGVQVGRWLVLVRGLLRYPIVGGWRVLVRRLLRDHMLRRCLIRIAITRWDGSEPLWLVRTWRQKL